MSGSLLVFWSLVGLGFIWLGAVVVLKSKTETLDPTSWHYRWISWQCRAWDNCVPTDSCRYFGKLAFMPVHTALILLRSVALLVFLVVGTVGRLILDWTILPACGNRLRWNLYHSKKAVSIREPLYWKEMGRGINERAIRIEKFLPVPPILILLGIGFLFVFIKSGVGVFAGKATNLEYWFFVISATLFCVLPTLYLLIHRSEPQKLWETIENRFCRELAVDWDKTEKQN